MRHGVQAVEGEVKIVEPAVLRGWFTPLVPCDSPGIWLPALPSLLEQEHPLTEIQLPSFIFAVGFIFGQTMILLMK